jgi:hypothetical protein
MSEGRKLKIKEASDEAKAKALLSEKRSFDGDDMSAKSATIVTLDEADIEMARAWGDQVCDVYEKLTTPAEALAMGFLAATQRYNDDLDCSVACTKEALTLARHALDKAEVETAYAQVPGYCHVFARKVQECNGKPLPWWSCLPTPLSKEVAPVVFVALTDGVNVHFIPHSSEVAGDFFKVFGAPCADSEAPVHGPRTRAALTEAGDAIETRLLNAGDVFVTHSGMPYYFEPAEPGTLFAVQCVPTVKLSPGNRQYQKWNEVLTARGIYKRGKFNGEHMLHACITERATSQLTESTFAGVATKEEVPWLTNGASSSSGSASKKQTDGPRPEVTAAIARHDALLERIKKLDSDGWNAKLEKFSKDRRDSIQPQAQMKDVHAFTKCLDTLEKNLNEAEDKRELVVELRNLLNDCEERVNAVELPAEAKNELRMRESRLKTISEIRAKGGALYDQDKAIRALADQVTNFENACRARLEALASKKRPRSPSAPTAKTPAPVVSLQPLPENVADLQNMQSFAASDEALTSLIKKWDSVKGEYATLAAAVADLQPYYKIFGTSLYTVKQEAKKSSYCAVNIGPIMFVDEQLDKFRQARLAANAAAGSAAAAATLGAASAGERLVTNEGFVFDFSNHGSKSKCALDMCGQMRNVFVNGFCKEHSGEMVHEALILGWQELYDEAGSPDEEEAGGPAQNPVDPTMECDADIYDALNPINDEVLRKYEADPMKSKADFISFIKTIDEGLKIIGKPLFKSCFTDEEEKVRRHEASASNSPDGDEGGATKKTRTRGRIVEENLDGFIDDEDQEYVGSSDEEEEGGGPSKKNMGSDLAHRILMMLVKANVYLKTDALVQEYVRAQDNEDDLNQVEAHLRDLERIKTVYAIKQTDPNDGEETFYPYVFDVKAMAQDKLAALGTTGGFKYSIVQKEF